MFGRFDECGMLHTLSGLLERLRQNLSCSNILWAYRVAGFGNVGVGIDFPRGGGKLGSSILVIKIYWFGVEI